MEHQISTLTNEDFLKATVTTTKDMRGAWTPLTWVEDYHFAYSGPFNKAQAALTFDDGPDETFTPKILEILRKHDVKATFFLLGENMLKYPDLARQIAAEGHVIGNHTFSHPKLTDLDEVAYRHEIRRADSLILQMIGYKPRYFRPTYGAITEAQVSWASKRGMMVIQWSIDTEDWRGKSADEITGIVMKNLLPGSIILQHNADGVPLEGSVEALDGMINALHKKGTKLVTLEEMFGWSRARSW